MYKEKRIDKDVMGFLDDVALQLWEEHYAVIPARSFIEVNYHRHLTIDSHCITISKDSILAGFIGFSYDQKNGTYNIVDPDLDFIKAIFKSRDNDGIMVKENFRGRNFGRALLNYGIGVAFFDYLNDLNKSKNSDFIVNAAGIRKKRFNFYSRFGFCLELVQDDPALYFGTYSTPELLGKIEIK